MKKYSKFLLNFIAGSTFLVSSNLMAKKFVTIKNASAYPELFQQLEDKINSEFPDIDVGEYLTGVADASSFSTSGLGVDYSDDMSLFMIGVQLGAAADLNGGSIVNVLKGDIEADKVRGVGANLSVSLGLNLKILPFNIGPINTDKMKVFVNLASLSDFELNKEAKIETSTFGMHLQYKILDDIGASFLAKWEGINITVGVQTTKFDYSYTKNISQSITDSGVTASFSGPVRVGVKGSATSIPLEVSTGARVGYVASVYGGLGFDIRVGEADGYGNGSGPITASSAATGDETADAVFNLNESEEASSGGSRAFIGLQANISLLKIYAQLQKSMNDDLLGANVGVRVMW